MELYRVLLEDKALHSIELEANDALDARARAEELIEEGTVCESLRVEDVPSMYWEVHSVEPVHE